MMTSNLVVFVLGSRNLPLLPPLRLRAKSHLKGRVMAANDHAGAIGVCLSRAHPDIALYVHLISLDIAMCWHLISLDIAL